MGGLNYDALREADKELGSKGEKTPLFIQPKQIGEKTLFRPVIPAANLDGKMHFEVIVWWIKKTPYISWKTFGRECIIEKEVEAAKALEDADVNELLEDDKSFSMDKQEWVAGLLLKESDDGRLSVVDKMVKILQAKPTLLKRINKASYTKMAQAAGEWGLCERETGWVLALSKIGTGRDTEYDAQLHEQVEMPAKYYKHEVDLREIAKQSLKSQAYMQAVIRNYLYAEEIPDELEAKEKARQEKFKTFYKELMAKVRPDAPKKESEVAETKVAKKAPVKKASIEPEDIDFEEVEDTPAKPTAVKKPAKPTLDDEFEDDLPFESAGAVKKPAAATKKATPKAATPAKARKITDDVEETTSDDFEDDIDDL